MFLLTIKSSSSIADPATLSDSITSCSSEFHYLLDVPNVLNSFIKGPFLLWDSVKSRYSFIFTISFIMLNIINVKYKPPLTFFLSMLILLVANNHLSCGLWTFSNLATSTLKQNDKSLTKYSKCSCCGIVQYKAIICFIFFCSFL